MPDNTRRKKFADLMAALAKHYNRRNFGAAEVERYRMALARHSIEAIGAALQTHLVDTRTTWNGTPRGNVFPTIADVITQLNVQTPPPAPVQIEPLPSRDDVLESSEDGFGVRIYEWSKANCQRTLKADGPRAVQAWINARKDESVAEVMAQAERDEARG